MLGMRPMDSQVALEQQLQDHHAEPVVLMIVFTVDADDVDAFKAAYAKDAAFTKAQPGFISAQLHQGIAGSTIFLDYAVFENVTALAEITKQPEFEQLREIYPDSASASLHLLRRVAIPGICLGEPTNESVGDNSI